jgi:diadenosine tetraphosphate (Ap4A) HIT family hydrolase
MGFFHAHVHLIPKWSESEGLVYERGRSRHVDQKEMAERIRVGLARSG